MVVQVVIYQAAGVSAGNSEVIYDALWSDELAGINKVGISNAVVPCQVSQVLPIIAPNPAQGIAAAGSERGRGG